MPINFTKNDLTHYFQTQTPLQTIDTTLTSELVPASVLLPIITSQHGLELLFTQRTSTLKFHAGQISFPGGRREAQDVDLLATALRETEEEIGLVTSAIEVLGPLPYVISRTGFLVTPYAGVISPPFSLNLNSIEVAAVFTAPIEYLFDANNHFQEKYWWQGTSQDITVIKYQGYRIWGMTAQIIVKFAQLLQANR